MKERPKIFVINKGGHDYSDAQRYGDLVYLTEGPLHNPFGVANFYRHVAGKMKDMSSDDYILITSLNSLCALAGWIVGRLGHPLNLLLFKDGKYIPRRISENDLLKIGESDEE